MQHKRQRRKSKRLAAAAIAAAAADASAPVERPMELNNTRKIKLKGICESSSGSRSRRMRKRTRTRTIPELSTTGGGEASCVCFARLRLASRNHCKCTANKPAMVNSCLATTTPRRTEEQKKEILLVRSRGSLGASSQMPMVVGGNPRLAALIRQVNMEEEEEEEEQEEAATTTRRTQQQQQPKQSNSLASQQDEMDLIKSASRTHQWHWNELDKSNECIVSDDKLEVCFHPQCSESAAAIRGSQPLIRNGNYYYWEVKVFDKTYGTSVMFGLCTKEQQLHANDYCNLIGLDQNGWSLSHKGHIWHDGKYAQYTKTFPTNQSVTIGLLFNTMRGELSYYMNGKSLGVAFCGLNNLNTELYPVIGSTAKCTRMRLLGTYCGYVSLLERSCFTLLNNARDKVKLVENLHQYQVPKNLIEYLAREAEVCGSQTVKKYCSTQSIQLEC